jgi:hypothetical protein
MKTMLLIFPDRCTFDPKGKPRERYPLVTTVSAHLNLPRHNATTSSSTSHPPHPQPSYSTWQVRYRLMHLICSDHPTVNVRENRRSQLVGKSVHLSSREPGTEENPTDILRYRITLSSLRRGAPIVKCYKY